MGSRTTARLWHCSLALVVLAALIIQLTLTARGEADASGVVQPAATRFIRLFSYFTIQSNILILIGALTLTANPDRDGRLWRVVRLDAMLGIVITGLVYATVLAGTVHPTGAGWWSNLGFHYIAPWWALLGWLVFGPRPRIDRHTLAWAVVWPVLWIGYTLAHGAATGWYPYPFTDVTVLGYAATLRNLSFIVLLAVVFAVLLRLLDQRLPAGRAAGTEVERQGAPR
jgi:hypothetical protein